MRNLKRLLTLFMAIAMMMSLMVVGAGAAFKDQDKIENTDAVNMNVALGIINGRDDGSFDPAGNVTRAEMAKMICVLLNGGKAPTLSAKATPVFTDIKGHWGEGFIEYCASLGIIAGMGDGTFAPDKTVTATQAAKMLLVALGYDAAFEGFNGASWSVKIGVAANQKDLYDELGVFDPNAALNRDDAAQMIWNALQAKEVKYTYSLTTVNGQLQNVQTREDKADSLMTDKFKTFDTDFTTGIMTSVTYNDTKKEYTYSVAVNAYNDKGDKYSSFKSKVDYTALFGHNVCVVAKATDNVYGMYADDSNVVFSGLIGDIDFKNAVDSKATVEFNDKDYDLSKDKTAKIDTKIAAFNTAGDVLDDTPDNVKDFYKATAIDNNDDDKIDLIVYYPVLWGEVTYVNKDYIRVDFGATSADLGEATQRFDFDDNSIYTGVAKEDYVMIDLNDVTYGTNCGVITELKEQTAKLTAVSDDYATLDGTKYDSTLVTIKDTQLKDDIDFLVINGYLVKASTSSGDVDLKDYLLVSGIATGTNASNGRDAKVYFTDGTSAVVNVKSFDADNDGAYDDAITGVNKDTVYKYEVSKGDYKLSAYTTDSAKADGFDDAAQGGAITWTKSTSSSDANAKIASNKIATDAVVFLKDGNDYSVITGAKLAKTTTAAYDAGTNPTGLVVNAYGAEDNDDSGYRYITMAFVTGSAISKSDLEYGFVTTKVETLMNADDEKYLSFKMWNGTDEVAMTTDADYVPTLAKGDIISYTLDGTVIDELTVLPATGSSYGAITAFDTKNIEVLAKSADVDTSSAKVNLEIDEDDTTILYISKADKTGDKTGNFMKADKGDTGVKTMYNDGTTHYYANVLYIGVDDGVADLIVIDVDNDILDVR